MKRLRLSEREVITFRPRRMSSRQSSGSGSRARMLSRLPAIDLMGASELFSSWPSTRTSRCHACSSCSLSAWVRSEITTSSSGRPCSRMRVRRTPQRPAPPGKTRWKVLCGGPFQAGFQAQLRGRLAQQPLRGRRQQPLAGAVDQAQPPALVEGEDGHVDLAHHRAQQRGGLHGAQPLLAQRAAQRVDLAHHFAQRVVRARRTAAHRKIAFAQRRQQVGERLQREHHALPHRQGEAHPRRHDQHREGPLGSGRNRRSTGCAARWPTPAARQEGQQHHAAFVAEARGFACAGAGAGAGGMQAIAGRLSSRDRFSLRTRCDLSSRAGFALAAHQAAGSAAPDLTARTVCSRR